MTRQTSMILWGATGHSKVLRECLRGQRIELLAVFDNDSNVPPPFSDVPLHAGRIGFQRWKESRGDLAGMGFLVAIGGELGRDRIEIQEWLSAEGLVPLTAVHPTAFVAGSARVGSGSQVLAQAAVCVEARLGRGCIINTGATVDHECALGDGVHLAPGAHLGGCVSIGSYGFVGAGATVLPRVQIGSGAVVGAGAVVIRDVDPYSVVVGNPARVVGSRKRQI